jgi:hypothetical protein
MWCFIFGLILGAAILAFVLWIHSRKIQVTWYEWLMGALALVLILLILQNFFASYAEFEPTAGWMGLIFMGIPVLILAVLAVRLPWQRHARDKAR